MFALKGTSKQYKAARLLINFFRTCVPVRRCLEAKTAPKWNLFPNKLEEPRNDNAVENRQQITVSQVNLEHINSHMNTISFSCTSFFLFLSSGLLQMKQTCKLSSIETISNQKWLENKWANSHQWQIHWKGTTLCELSLGLSSVCTHLG